MGLDMYLYKHTYLPFEEGEKLAKVQIHGLRGVRVERVSYVVEKIGYWRKANAIHKWFVDNVQDGKDECHESYVSREDLEELLEIVKQVEADHAKARELLPTREGFFFGGTDYDNWYFEDIKRTIEIIQNALKEDDSEAPFDFYYRSSW